VLTRCGCLLLASFLHNNHHFLYNRNPKTCRQTFSYIFAKYRSIFKFFTSTPHAKFDLKCNQRSTNFPQNVPVKEFGKNDVQCKSENFTRWCILNFTFQRLKISKRYFTRLVCIQIYAKIQSFVRIFLALTVPEWVVEWWRESWSCAICRDSVAMEWRTAGRTSCWRWLAMAGAARNGLGLMVQKLQRLTLTGRSLDHQTQ